MADVVIVGVVMMNEREARECIDSIKRGAELMYSGILELHTRQGWRALGYATERACLSSEFKVSESRSYDLLNAARISKMIGSDIPERHARELVPAMDKPNRVRAIHRDVTQRTNGSPKAVDYREAVRPGTNADTDKAVVVIDTLIRKVGDLDIATMAGRLRAKGRTHEGAMAVAMWFKDLAEQMSRD